MNIYCVCKTKNIARLSDEFTVYHIDMNCGKEIQDEDDTDRSDEYRENQEIEAKDQLERAFEANTFPRD